MFTFAEPRSCFQLQIAKIQSVVSNCPFRKDTRKFVALELEQLMVIITFWEILNVLKKLKLTKNTTQSVKLVNKIIDIYLNLRQHNCLWEWRSVTSHE